MVVTVNELVRYDEQILYLFSIIVWFIGVTFILFMDNAFTIKERTSSARWRSEH